MIMDNPVSWVFLFLLCLALIIKYVNKFIETERAKEPPRMKYDQDLVFFD